MRAVDVQVERDVVREVVLIERQCPAAQQVRVGVPHVFEAPQLVVGAPAAVLVVEGKELARDPIMGFDRDTGIFGLDRPDDGHDPLGVLLAGDRDTVPVLGGPAAPDRSRRVIWKRSRPAKRS